MFFFNLYIRLINAFSFRHAFLFDTALIICKTKVSCMTLRTCIYWPIDPNAQKCTISVLVLIVAFFLFWDVWTLPLCLFAASLHQCIMLKNSNFVVTVYGSSLYIACGAGTRDEPLRTSAWEATLYSVHTGKGNSAGWPQLFKRRTAATIYPLCKSLTRGKLVCLSSGMVIMPFEELGLNERVWLVERLCSLFCCTLANCFTIQYNTMFFILRG